MKNNVHDLGLALKTETGFDFQEFR